MMQDKFQQHLVVDRRVLKSFQDQVNGICFRCQSFSKEPIIYDGKKYLYLEDSLIPSACLAKSVIYITIAVEGEKILNVYPMFEHFRVIDRQPSFKRGFDSYVLSSLL